VLEAMIGIYGLILWLVFKKFKLIPVTTYTVCTAILIGAVMLGFIAVSTSVFHPQSTDGRMYAPIVQIVPQVRGTVIDVPVEANVPVKKGDVLFRIDPQPYQIEVDRLRALLAAKNSKFAQLSEQMAGAEAATRQARAALLASESSNDRQLRESLERAKSQTAQTKDRLDLATKQYDRAKSLYRGQSIAQAEYDRAEANFQSVQKEFAQVQSDEKLATEKLKEGSSSLEATRQELARAEANERQVRLQLKAEVDGLNPDVREVTAMLDKARFDLEETSVKAPTDGYVPQKLLRPGMMAVPFPVKPLMMFVVGEQPTLVATFPQRTISDIKPGMKGEAAFKLYPGRSFKVKVRRVLTAMREGELDATGQIAVATAEHEPGYVPIVFDYEEDVTGLNLPIGAQATVAVYTDRMHPLSFLRMIVLRIKSWENYIF
jgi:multidrug resistance efflux pump